ncbi:MAG: phosphoribosyltransferase [Burkholderiaceae bacterium]|jgi:hypoxanthine phosphoribosyltransferase
MSTEPLKVGWEQYHRLIERLALQIHDSGWAFDTVLGLARGGLRVADVLSRIFKKPLAVVAASSYRDENGTVQGDLYISARIATTASKIGPRVLLVDDLADSGRTLAMVAPHLKNAENGIEAVRTAVLWLKGISAFRPDYFVESLPDNPWIHQPFEYYDMITPDALRREAQDAV